MLQPSLVCEQEDSPDEPRELVDQGLDSINNLFECDKSCRGTDLKSVPLYICLEFSFFDLQVGDADMSAELFIET